MHSTRGNAPIVNIAHTNSTVPIQCAASSQQIQAFQVMQVSNVADEQPSTSLGLQKPSTGSSPLLASLLSNTRREPELRSSQEKFPFKVKRGFASDRFWDLLLEKLPQEQFYQRYNEFLLTNWNCSKKQRDHLIKIRNNARTAKKRYNALVQSHFQYDLRVSGFKLIHSILGIGRYTRMLRNVTEFEIKKTKNSLNNSLKNINENYALAYKKYTNFLNKLNEKKPTMEQIESLENALVKTRRQYSCYSRFFISQDVILDIDEIPDNLNFINSMLNKIQGGKLLPLNIATELAKEYKPFIKQSIPSLRKRANESPQDNEEPFAKRNFTQLEQLLLTPSSFNQKNRQTQAYTNLQFAQSSVAYEPMSLPSIDIMPQTQPASTQNNQSDNTSLHFDFSSITDEDEDLNLKLTSKY